MADKYRIKLANGRIVGPFLDKDVETLISDGKVAPDSQIQKFPAGDWTNLEDSIFSKSNQSSKTQINLSLKELLAKKNKKEPVQAEKPAEILNVDSESKKTTSKKGFVEFDYRNPEANIPKPLIEDLNLENIEKPLPVEEKSIQSAKLKVDETVKKMDKTVIVKTDQRKIEVDKTVLKHGLRVGLELKKEIDQKKIEEEKKAEEVVEETEEEKLDIVNEKTVIEKFDLAQIKADANKSEREMNKEIAIKIEEAENQKREEKLKKETEKLEEEKIEEEEGPKKKKSVKPIVAVVLILLLAYLFLDEDEAPKELPPIQPVIEFPISAEYEDEEKAKIEFEKGMEELQGYTYPSRLKSGVHFRKSLEFKFKDNPSLGKIIYVYSELLNHADSKAEHAKTIFQLLKIAQVKILTDINIALGAAAFYLQMEKYHSAKNVIENFLRIEKNQPNKDIFCYYLESLLKTGDLVKASDVYEKLKGAGKLPLQCYISIANYNRMEERKDLLKNTLDEGLKNYPGSVPMMLEAAKILLSDKDLGKYTKVLFQIRETFSERSPLYYSKYLEHMGMLSALQGDVEKANGFFNLALTVRESNELRSKLASLRVSGTKRTESLILESKIIDYMNNAKSKQHLNELQKALNYAIQASDLSETYIPAHLLLAKIQIQMGYFDTAIQSLERLQADLQANFDVSYLLAYAYLEAYKLNDAKKLVQSLNQTKFSNSAKYSYLLAEFYEKSKNATFALRYYQEAISRDPVNDVYYFRLAKLLLYLRKYSEGQRFLSDAIQLDPTNIEYRSLYAKILYELQSPETAIGYLRDLLISNPDNASLLGEIAIYYYKSGKMKDFNETKGLIEKLPTKDSNFYRFMIEANKDEGKLEEVVLYTEEFLKIEPGNLTVRMELAEFLFNSQKYSLAKVQLEIIKNKLQTYPRVHFYLASVYLKLGDVEKARENAELEIKNSPDLDLGYYILGQIHFSKDEFPEAISMFEKAIQKNPKSLPALKGLAWIKYKQSFFAEAREFYLRVIKEDAGDAEAHKGLGYVYKDMGQGSLGAEEFEVYLNLSPNAADKQEIQSIINSLK